jgi:nucleoside-diphosphate-sugar epimerase
MNITITGAAGFLGQRLIAALLARGELTGSGGALEPISEITACDIVAPAPWNDLRVKTIACDIGAPADVAAVIGPQTDTVFHLAAVVSGQAEQDFDLGMRVNFEGTRTILERTRHAAPGARFVMTSSVAVFGGELPGVLPDSQVWEPKSSYGTQKAINDLLMADYSRRGFVDGRSLRMPTIVVRPGKPNKAASSFASGIIREPLHGLEAICPVAPDTLLWLMSPASAIANILHGHELPGAELGTRRVINMPGLSIKVADMLAALRRIGGDEAADRVILRRDPAIEAIVNSWPGAFSADYAKALGFVADTDFDEVIRAFVAEMG